MVSIKANAAVRLATPSARPCQAHSGDAVARFNTVIAPYLDDAYALARWLTGSGPDAEDVVQEASLRAFRGIFKFANGSARAWLLAIVRNTAYDWLRKNRAGTVIFVDDVEEIGDAELSESGTPTPEAALLQSEEATLLGSAISALPTHYREMLVLREVQGLSYRDIAQIAGISIGTTMSRLFRARRLMIAHLKNYGVSEARTAPPAQH